jgi:gamma-glutamyl hercynylcysteine S-oxide synthase
VVAAVGGSLLDDPRAIREAGRDWLSLALLDARNHLLARLARDESPAALRLALQAGVYQEHWIGCHVQRGRGEACDPHGVRLAGLEPAVQGWLAPQGPLPTPDAVRGYLGATLEVTLDLLAGTAEGDAALHFFRQSLLHEDRLGEALDALRPHAGPPARAVRSPLLFGARPWTLGDTPAAGWAPGHERGRLDTAVPEFEIDAQAVNWAQVVEFADDGGYDRAELWSDTGWAWVQAVQRRAPLHVEQLRGGVLVQRAPAQAGQPASLHRAAPGQAAVHVSRHEAQAWCQWAGRRLPTEPEWDIAARTGASRGFVWGDVFEWVAGSARHWPGAPPPAPGTLDPPPPPGWGVLRGASFATRPRWHHPQARRFVPPDSDTMFCGFRSCAL